MGVVRTRPVACMGVVRTRPVACMGVVRTRHVACMGVVKTTSIRLALYLLGLPIPDYGKRIQCKEAIREISEEHSSLYQPIPFPS
jgi:hypothetical protein